MSTHVLGPGDGRKVDLGGLGVRYMIEADGFALVEHPIEPRALAAPVHTHAREDEYTYVVEGEVGFEIGHDVFTANPGDLVSKPRGIQHAFWNPGDVRARALEIISPPGFARYFEELAPLLAKPGPPDVEAI